jgi:hypothetical protein
MLIIGSMTSEIFKLSAETARVPDEYEQVNKAEYEEKIADISAVLGYEGPANRSLYELAMRMTEGKPDARKISRVVQLAHEYGLISDQFSSNQLAIFRNIGDNSLEWNGGRDTEILDQPLWQRIVAEAEANPIIYGDPDTLWKDISQIYGFDLDTTFNSVANSVKQENEINIINHDLSPNERLYTAPVWASYDMFSDEQMPPGTAYGKGTDW